MTPEHPAVSLIAPDQTPNKRIVTSTLNSLTVGFLRELGLEKYNLQDYDFHLSSGLQVLDSQTERVVTEMGLGERGEIPISLLSVVPKNDALKKIVEDERLRLKFRHSGEQEHNASLFTIGYEVDGEYENLADLWLYVGDEGRVYGADKSLREGCLDFFQLSNNLKNFPLSCLGIYLGERAAATFSVEMPEKAVFLFKQDGWMKTEEEIQRMLNEMASQVSLNPDNLSSAIKRDYQQYLDDFQQKRIVDLIDKIAIKFGLDETTDIDKVVKKAVVFDQDMEAELKVFDPDGGGENEKTLCVTIKNLILPEISKNRFGNTLETIRKPLESSTSQLGDLIVWVMDDNIFAHIKTNETSPFVDVYNFCRPEKLAAILAKLSLRES